MGTWGTGSFDDDPAMDFVRVLSESTDDSVVGSALEEAIVPSECLDADRGQTALAARLTRP
jgi:hypothetical protein